MSSLLKTVFMISCIFAVQSMAADTVKVSANTANPPNGTYGINYEVAVWIQNAAGAFIKTIGFWGSDNNANDFPIWNSHNGGIKTVDGISGATLTAPATLTPVWNKTDGSGVTVPNGTYTVNIELNNRHNSPWYVRDSIVVDGVPKTRVGAVDSSLGTSSTYITTVVLNYVSSGAAVVNRGGSALQQMLILSPNPFREQVIFSLPTALQRSDIKIYNLNGNLVAVLPGASRAVWTGTGPDGVRVAEGVYLYLIHSGKATESGRLFLIN